MLEMQIKEEEKKHNMELKAWDKKIKEAESKLTELNQDLKEKE